MGFPEILFNLFPGMGAMTLLSRKIGYHQAEKIILSGKVYSSEEMLTQVTYRVGIVLILYATAAVTISLYAGPVTTV